MNSVRKSWKIGLLAGAALAVGITFGTVGSDVASADGHLYKERNTAMKMIGGNMKKLGQAVAGGDNVAAATAAETIATISDNVPALFETKSIPAESRAKPEIWDNFDDFKSKAAAMATAARKVAADAKSGNMGSDPKAVVGSIGATCGACHKVYRGPKV